MIRNQPSSSSTVSWPYAASDPRFAFSKSRDYINRQTELMILITPYVVRAVAQRICRVRTMFRDVSDGSTILLVG